MKKYYIILSVGVMIPLVYAIVYYLIPTTGAIYTHDSIAYTYGAKTLLGGKGILYFGYKTPIMQWPPLYTVLMIVPLKIGIEPEIFVRMMNPLLHVILVMAVAMWLRKYMCHKWIVYVGVVLLTFSLPIIHVMRFIWTEPVFIVLLVLAFICFHNYVMNLELKWLIMAAILSSLCWLTRYMGVTLLMTVTIYMLFLEQPLRKKVGHVFIYGTIASIPMGLWVIRNLMISQSFTGSRGTNKMSFLWNVRKSLHIGYSWFASTDSKIGLFGLVLLALILILIVIALWKRGYKMNGDKSRSSMGMVLITFISLYSGILLIIASNYSMDSLNYRMWMPIYVPVIWLLFIVVDQLLEGYRMDRAGGLRSWCVTLSIMIAFICISIYPMTYFIKDRHVLHEAKEGYMSYGQQSKIIPYIKDMELGNDDVILTNNPALLTFKTYLDCRWTPKRKSIELYEYNAIMSSINKKQVYIVWFGDPDNGTFYTVDELRKDNNSEKIKSFNEGSVYRISRES